MKGGTRGIRGRKIDTRWVCVLSHKFELTIYIQPDDSFIIRNEESALEISGPSLIDLREQAMQYLETYVGVKWEPKLLVEFGCGEGWSKDEHKITFWWKPILVRDRYDEHGKKRPGKVYRDNDGSRYRHTTDLRLCTSKQSIVAILDDTPSFRSALEQFAAAIDSAGERIAQFLQPDKLERSIIGGFQKILGG